MKCRKKKVFFSAYTLFPLLHALSLFLLHEQNTHRPTHTHTLFTSLSSCPSHPKIVTRNLTSPKFFGFRRFLNFFLHQFLLFCFRFIPAELFLHIICSSAGIFLILHLIIYATSLLLRL